ncbi:MAG: dihydropteroate synthase [Bacteroidota bacterium]
MDAKDTFFTRKKTLNCCGKIIDLSTPLAMGILNITPDSFYDGGTHFTVKQADEHVGKMIDEGASIIDVGAVSTRPGAVLPDEKEELKRLVPVLQMLRSNFPDIVISVDTFRSKVAEKVTGDFPVAIINDVSSGEMDPEMPGVVARAGVAYIMMHMQGVPGTMQKNPVYKDVVCDQLKYFADKTEAFRKLGINDLLIDPGFGFGKNIEHNYEILSKLEMYGIFELPIVAGLSRKSMICRLLDCGPEEALNGTTALNMMALMKGADILRVHDVKEAMETIRIFKKAGMINQN